MGVFSFILSLAPKPSQYEPGLWQCLDGEMTPRTLSQHDTMPTPYKAVSRCVCCDPSAAAMQDGSRAAQYLRSANDSKSPRCGTLRPQRSATSHAPQHGTARWIFDLRANFAENRVPFSGSRPNGMRAILTISRPQF
jgi:hypothetical protein